MCKDAHLPVTATVYKWMLDHPEFAAAYARAREDQADTFADEIVAISDDSRNDTQVDDDGVTIVNHDVIARAKLRVDARKWAAARQRPNSWGDKVNHSHGGAVALTVVTSVPDPA